jgi:DNA-directed RNA polymerase subunit H (RpoH/RPB5)
MMTPPQDIIDDLKKHLALCQELLLTVEREGQTLRRSDNPSLFEFYQLRKNLLPRLNQSLDSLRRHRVSWQKFSLDERARYPEIGMLLRQNQDLTMKIIVLDRENEQSLLRRGLVPPRELPSVNRQRPHFVAELYRRQGAS